MSDQDKIIQLLQAAGPSLPTKVAKSIGSDTLLASAHLSDLSSRGKVRISHLKIGGSPLYYLPGQEEQLYGFAAGNVNPKDLQVLNELKEKKILRENELDALHKISLRSLKDFAVPLQVTFNGATELFWKWHLFAGDDANARIRGIVLPLQGIMRDNAKGGLLSGEHAHSAHGQQASALAGVERGATDQQDAVLSEKSTAIAMVATTATASASAPQPIAPSVTETQTFLNEKSPPSGKKHLLEKVKEKLTRKKQQHLEFLSLLERYFRSVDITIEQKEILRKNAELNLFLKVPSAVGTTRYFCKVKQKKRCDEKDISSAYMEAQIKKLPLLFLYTGDLTKKAEELSTADTFENMIVKKIG